ncbi:MAG: hypothetical protein ACLSAP_07370 [Oscillospiraceae bacterium]
MVASSFHWNFYRDKVDIRDCPTVHMTLSIEALDIPASTPVLKSWLKRAVRILRVRLCYGRAQATNHVTLTDGGGDYRGHHAEPAPAQGLLPQVYKSTCVQRQVMDGAGC